MALPRWVRFEMEGAKKQAGPGGLVGAGVEVAAACLGSGWVG